ncbi:hypothetical protein SROCM77S_00407 [Streptomyces rochei]
MRSICLTLAQPTGGLARTPSRALGEEAAYAVAHFDMVSTCWSSTPARRRSAAHAGHRRLPPTPDHPAPPRRGRPARELAHPGDGTLHHRQARAAAGPDAPRRAVLRRLRRPRLLIAAGLGLRGPPQGLRQPVQSLAGRASCPSTTSCSPSAVGPTPCPASPSRPARRPPGRRVVGRFPRGRTVRGHRADTGTAGPRPTTTSCPCGRPSTGPRRGNRELVEESFLGAGTHGQPLAADGGRPDARGPVQHRLPRRYPSANRCAPRPPDTSAATTS